MAPLKCCTFNCRGWKNGKLSLQNYINSLDFCFIQEHWLFDDHLNDVREICSDFLSVGVSGMNSDTLRCGRPYGGCSILYRKSLSSCISLLQSNSDRFCGIRLCDSSGLSYLLVSVYMPTYYDPSCVNVYLNVLGELEGFIASQGCDVNIIAGDFNVDFDRGGQFAKLLKDFMAGLDLHACDLNFRSSVNYTYERDDCVTQSWLAYVLRNSRLTYLISMLFILLPSLLIISPCSLIPQSLASYHISGHRLFAAHLVQLGPRSPLLISIVTVIWSLAQLPLYPLRFIAALLLTAQSIIILSTLMLGIFFPLFSIVLGNVSHNTVPLLVD